MKTTCHTYTQPIPGVFCRPTQNTKLFCQERSATVRLVCLACSDSYIPSHRGRAVASANVLLTITNTRELFGGPLIVESGRNFLRRLVCEMHHSHTVISVEQSVPIDCTSVTQALLPDSLLDDTTLLHYIVITTSVAFDLGVWKGHLGRHDHLKDRNRTL